MKLSRRSATIAVASFVAAFIGRYSRADELELHGETSGTITKGRSWGNSVSGTNLPPKFGLYFNLGGYDKIEITLEGRRVVLTPEEIMDALEGK